MSTLQIFVIGTLIWGCVVALHGEDQDGENAATPLRHPCTRACGEKREAAMTCRYQWTVENYLTLSRACFACPLAANISDCTRGQCVSADGIQRAIRAINRQVPGPSIQVCEGDTIEVEVTNQMMNSEGLTIHWHGVLQRQSPHMDGVAMVTQCPIPTATSFTYRFLAEDPGTHFYHSHSGLFRADGLFGSIVVRQPPSRDPQRHLYDLDLPEHVIVVADWTHEAIVDVYAAFFHTGGFGNQVPDSILINGRGIHPTTRAHLVSGTTATPMSEFRVKPGVRYRFRLVSAGALRCPVEVSVDGHPLLLIASDGSPVEPFTVSSILVFSGERYDFVLEGKESGGEEAFWIRARGFDKCQENKVQQFAILKYTDHVTHYPRASMDYDDSALSAGGVRFNQWFLPSDETAAAEAERAEPDEHAQISNMTSVEPDDASLRREPDRRIYLDFAYRIKPNYHFHDPVLYPAHGKGFKSVSSVTINNISNSLPPSPMLTQPHDLNPDLFCNWETTRDRNCSSRDVFCECTHREEVEEGEVVELVIINSNRQESFTHPLHLHGYRYRVVAADRLEQPITRESFIDLDKKGKIPRRLHGAPYKDTLPIPNGGYLILRLQANNPGVWFMHCHVALHAETGMALTLQVNDAHGRLPKTPSDFPRCGNWQPNKPSPRHHSLSDVSRDGDDNDVTPGGDAEKKDSDASASSTEGWLVPFLGVLTAANVLVVVCSILYVRRRGRGEGGERELRDISQGKGVRVRDLKSRVNCTTTTTVLCSDDERSTLIG